MRPSRSRILVRDLSQVHAQKESAQLSEVRLPRVKNPSGAPRGNNSLCRAEGAVEYEQRST